MTNLNADFLDGRSDASYALSSGQTGVILAVAEWEDVDGDLVNDALLAIAVCPDGTKLTGGGVDNFTGGPTLWNSPDAEGAWYGAADADPAVNVPDDVVAYAVCYNPRGAVPGAMTRDGARSASPKAISRRAARADAREAVGQTMVTFIHKRLAGAVGVAVLCGLACLGVPSAAAEELLPTPSETSTVTTPTDEAAGPDDPRAD